MFIRLVKNHQEGHCNKDEANLNNLERSPEPHGYDVIPAKQNVKLDEEDLGELNHETNKDCTPEKQGAPPFGVVWMGVVADVVDHIEGGTEQHDAVYAYAVPKINWLSHFNYY